MLQVDPEKRITVEKALKHPWITQAPFDPTDSCASLTETMETLQFTRRRVDRERTLLSDTPGFKPAKKTPVQIHQDVAVGKGKGPMIPPIPEETRDADGEVPSDLAPGTKAFMQVGGKGGDETLYGSSYIGDAPPLEDDSVENGESEVPVGA